MSTEKGQEEVLVEVNENVETNEEVSTEGLSEPEIEMAKKHGLIKAEEKPAEEPKKEVEVKTEETKEDNGEPVDPATFEEMDAVLEKDQEKFHKKFTPNAKALYFKHKKERNERQRLSKELETFKAEKDLDSVKNGASKAKLDKIKEALKGEVTVEAILNIIGEEATTDKEATSNFEKQKQVEAEKVKQFNQRVGLAEQIGKSKYENFDQIADLAQEVAKSNPRFMKSLAEVFNDTSIDEEAIVEEVVFIAQRNPKFKDLGKKASPEKQEEVTRAIANANKKPSTASLNGAGKSTFKSEDALTPEDVVNFSTDKWMKLSKKTRDRLLMEAS
jgi:chorismate mutase